MTRATEPLKSRMYNFVRNYKHNHSAKPEAISAKFNVMGIYYTVNYAQK